MSQEAPFRPPWASLTSLRAVDGESEPEAPEGYALVQYAVNTSPYTSLSWKACLYYWKLQLRELNPYAEGSIQWRKDMKALDQPDFVPGIIHTEYAQFVRAWLITYEENISFRPTRFHVGHVYAVYRQLSPTELLVHDTR